MRPWFSPLPCLILLLCCAVGTGDIVAQQKQTLLVGFANFPPFNYLDENGFAAGSNVELFRQAAAASRFYFQPKFYPLKRAQAMIRNGQLDILVCLGRQQFEQLGHAVDYSDLILGRVSLNAFHLVSTPSINTKEDLLGYGLVLRRGYSYAGLINWFETTSNNFSLQRVNSAQQGFRLIAAGRKDYFIDYRIPADMVNKKLQLPDITQSLLSSVTYSLVFAKKHNGSTLQSAVEAALIPALEL